MSFDRDRSSGRRPGRADGDGEGRGPERKFRPERPKSQWERQAETWDGPRGFFECCGTRYGACTPDALALMKQAHEARHAK